MAAQQTFAFLQSDEGPGKSAPTTMKRSAPVKQDHRAGQVAPSRPTIAPNMLDPSACGASPVTEKTDVLQRLRHQVGCVQVASESNSQPKISTGSQAIDSMLPTGGLKTNALTEWVSNSDSGGAATLSLIAAATHLRKTAGPLVVVDLHGHFYPPAALALGIAYEKIILVRPKCRADLVWAIDQALRCESVAGVWAMVSGRLDDRDARRFQLASEIGSTPGFLVRDRSVRGLPSFAETRFSITTQLPPAPSRSSIAAGRHLKVTLDRCRGGAIGNSVQIQLDDQARIHSVPQPIHPIHETAAVHLASQLANPATTRSSDRQQRRA